VMDLNVKSIFFLTQKLLPQLRAAATAEDPGRIINIGSIDGLGIPFQSTFSYPASKAAVHQLTRVLAARLSADNITANAIAPGPFESEMMAHTLKNFRKQIEERVPRGRIGSPEDMAGTAIYLASRASAYVTGSILALDGGSVTLR